MSEDDKNKFSKYAGIIFVVVMMIPALIPVVILGVVGYLIFNKIKKQKGVYYPEDINKVNSNKTSMNTDNIDIK